MEDGIADGLSSYSKDEAVLGEGGSEEEGQPHVHVLDIVLHPGIIHSKSEKVCGTAFSVKKKLRKFFGPFWVILGPFWAFLGHIWATLGHLGSFLAIFGPFRGIFG